MKIQIDIPKEIYKFVQIEKIKRDKNTLTETVIELLNEKKQEFQKKNGK